MLLLDERPSFHLAVRVLLFKSDPEALVCSQFGALFGWWHGDPSCKNFLPVDVFEVGMFFDLLRVPNSSQSFFGVSA